MCRSMMVRMVVTVISIGKATTLLTRRPSAPHAARAVRAVRRKAAVVVMQVRFHRRRLLLHRSTEGVLVFHGRGDSAM